MDKRKQEGFDPKGIGEKSEVQVLAALLMADMIVLHPYGDNRRYDLVVDENGKFIRIQCKTARMSKDGSRMTFKTSSQNWNTGNLRDYRGQADLFAVYCRERNEIYILSVNKSPIRESVMRTTDPKSGHTKGVKMARDYLFDGKKRLSDYL
jgi:hypothetical protein